MRRDRHPAEAVGMETTGGRFRRTGRFTTTRRSLRSELLVLRHELERLDAALNAGRVSVSARAELNRAFARLRTGEQAWLASRQPEDLLIVVEHLDGARDALEATVHARRRTRA